MVIITENVRARTIAREWRLKWTEDAEKLSLTQVQDALAALVTGHDFAGIEGLEDVQRVVCGCQHDFKVIISVAEDKFGAWEKDGFFPEAQFVDAVKKIGGVSNVETQTFTLAKVSVRKFQERLLDPTDPKNARRYTEREFIDFYGAAEAKRLWQQAKQLDSRVRSKTDRAINEALVFIKPHAVTEETKKLVSETLKAAGLRIQKEGSVKAEVIDKKKLIDKHYYAIASKATILKPKELNVPADKFQAKFGLGWEEALSKGVVYNAMDACEKLGIDSDGLDKLWGKSKKADKMIKFGGGFYCGIVEAEGKDPIYVFNGFFMSMRSKFTVPGESIYYYTVSWPADKLSWEKFRGETLGATNPEDAAEGSLRRTIFQDWEKLGLKGVPNVGDNGVHASASPFEALAERANWLGAKLEDDRFGFLAMQNGIPAPVLKAWGVDPQIVLDSEGKKGGVFDQLEDMDATACLAKMNELHQANKKIDDAAKKAAAEAKRAAKKTEKPEKSAKKESHLIKE